MKQIINQLIQKGYSGHPLSKQHYKGDESCLRAYNNTIIDGREIKVRQFSNFLHTEFKN